MELRAHLPALTRTALAFVALLLAAPLRAPAADATVPAGVASTNAPSVTPSTNAPAAVPPEAKGPGVAPGAPGNGEAPRTSNAAPASTNAATATAPPAVAVAPATNAPSAGTTPPAAPAPAPATPVPPPPPRPADMANSVGVGTVRTSAGAALTGRIAFVPGGVMVQVPGTEPQRVPLELVLDVSFQDRGEPPGSGAPGAASTRTNGAAVTTGSSAAGSGWNTLALGTGPVAKLTVDPEGWAVQGGGAGLRANTDSGSFVERRLEVSGQMTARLLAFDGTHPEAVAGLMLRDNLGDAAAYAFLGLRAGQGLCFQYRQIASGMTMRLTNVVQSLPAWIRLQRLGGSVAAELSADGREWTTIGRVNVNLGQSIRAGVVVSSGVDTATATAKFGELTLGAVGLGYTPTAGYPRVVLRGGSILVAPIESADESVVRLGGTLRGSLVSVLNLARLEFVPLPPDLNSRLEPERPGVLLADGDFLDGTLRGITTNALTVNSLLFGFRRFAAGSEAAALQAGAVEPEDVAFRVQLRNGSELRARQLTLGTNELRAESPLLGSMVVKGAEVRSVRRAGMER